MKEKSKLTRIDAVHRLEELAHQIENGTIRMGDKSFAVSDDVRVAIRARHDELEIDLRWRPNGKAEQAQSDDQTDEPTAPAG